MHGVGIGLCVLATASACVSERPSPPAPPARTLQPGYHLAGLAGFGGQGVIALAASPGGLIVGGAFAQGGTVRAAPLRWTGQAWEALPSLSVEALTVDRDGAVYAAERFFGCDECALASLYQLRGAAWEVVPGARGDFTTLVATEAGLVAAGTVELLGQRVRVALRRDGAWTPLATTLSSDDGEVSVRAVAERAGTLCLAGQFDAVDGTPAANVACLTGGVWSAVGDGLPGDVHALVFTAAGELVAGGRFTAVGGSHLARFDGATWRAVGGGVGGADAVVEALAVDGDQLLVGGVFTSPAISLARHVDGQWVAPPAPLAAVDGLPVVTDLVVSASGAYVAGSFDRVGDTPAAGILRWGAGGITSLRPADDLPLGITGEVRALLDDGDGVVAAGDFVAAGLTPARHAARLVGTTWSPMGGAPSPINVLHRRRDGQLLAGDEAGRVLAWDGVSWASRGGALAGPIWAMAEVDQTIIVGGAFVSAGAHLARWTEDGFAPMGAGVPAPVRALGWWRDRLCAGLDFGPDADPRDPTTSQPLWCWDGAAWAPDPTLAGTAVRALATMPDGSTLAVGALWDRATQTSRRILRWRDGWEEVLLGPVSSAPTGVVTDALGAYLSTPDGVWFWDGFREAVPIAHGDPVRALLPLPDRLWFGGRGSWEAPSGAGPLSSGLAQWR